MSDNYGKVCSFTNITNQDFTHSWGGQPFFIKAGETAMFPYDLANHLAKHLARKILLANDKGLTQYDAKDPTGGTGRAIWGEEEEKVLAAKILGESFQHDVPREKSEIELLKEQVANLQNLYGGTSPTPPKVSPTDGTGQLASTEEATKSPTPSGSLLDKVQIIAELEKQNKPFDRRWGKAKLLELLYPKTNEGEAS